MAGWIKLWRVLKDNGHLNMPGIAFKLWIYCLLEAAPYPDPTRDLDAGELWLSYDKIREDISEKGIKISKTTVSSALKYLKQNNYLELQVKKFKGIKAKVVNWTHYQSSTLSVPDENPVKKQASPLTSTVTVPARVLSAYPTSTPTVLVREPEPYSGTACEAPKNLKNKDLIVVVVELTEHFAKEFGRPLSPLEVSQLAKWRSEFPEELILAALARAALQDKRTLAYTGGILANWQKAGVRTVDEIPQEKPGRSRRESGQAGKNDAAESKKRDFIRSLYI